MIRFDVAMQPTPAWRDARAAAQAGPHLGDAWIAYREARRRRPLYLLGMDETGHSAAVGVAYETRSKWWPWSRPTCVLDRTPWRLPDGNTQDEDVVAGLVHWARERGIARLELDSFDGAELPGELGHGFEESQRFEFAWDLNPDDETRWAALKGSHRRKVRKAEKAGVTTTDETGPNAIRILEQLQGSTRSRRQSRGEDMQVPDAEQYRTLDRTLVAGDGARVLVARLEDRPLSCMLMGVLGNQAYYLMGGSSPEGLRVNSASLLMWRASALLLERGVQRLNLGGVPARAEQDDAVEHGLYRFKDGFGARRFLCRSGVLELR